jgi:group I intron endonuclease
MRHGSIYIATNKHTGDQYVGQTRKSVQKRWDSHWRTAACNASRKAKFQNALLEFGKESFDVEEVFVAFDAEALNLAEISVIADLKPAYNSSRGGKGLRPITVSDATKLKRSEAAKTRWANPEWKAKTILSLQLSHNTDAAKEHARKIAKNRIGTKLSSETKMRIALANTARHSQTVAINANIARKIHAQCSLGSSVDATCNEYGISKQAFYRYVKQLQLPLLGHKNRGLSQ